MKPHISHFLKRLYKLPQNLNRNEKIAIITLLAIILVFSNFSVRQHLKPKVTLPDLKKTFIEGGVGELHNLIPIYTQNDTEKDIDKLIYSSLVKYNDKREIVGDLADKWEISPDGKTYTFYLKDKKWQDGQPVVADDISFTISLIQNKQNESPYLNQFLNVQTNVLENEKVQFVLKNPYAPFLNSLTVYILPKHLLSSVKGKLTDTAYAKKPIGSGPFVLDKIEQNKNAVSVNLKANEFYGQKIYFKNFIFNLYQSDDMAEKAFQEKQIQGRLTQNETGKCSKTDLPQFKAIFFNLDKPSLSKDLRKALAFAVNKDEIITTNSPAEKIDLPILPGFLGFKEAERYNYNLDQAKKLYTKAKNKPSELILLIKDDEASTATAEVLKKQWEVLGLKVNIDAAPNGSFDQIISDRDFDLALFGVNQKADPDPYALWHSSQIGGTGMNIAGYQNKEVDKLLEEARQTMDQNLRKTDYEKFIDMMQADLPAIYLYRPIYKYCVSDIIIGVSDIAGVNKADRFWNVENWTIKK